MLWRQILVGIQLWIYRRDIKASLGPSSITDRVEGVLLLLLESGSAYRAVWVGNIAANSQRIRHDTVDGFMVFAHVTYLLAGIYPTFLVVAVTAQQRTTAESVIRGLEVKTAF